VERPGSAATRDFGRLKDLAASKPVVPKQVVPKSVVPKVASHRARPKAVIVLLAEFKMAA
jgi:hypothetical protein